MYVDNILFLTTVLGGQEKKYTRELFNCPRYGRIEVFLRHRKSYAKSKIRLYWFYKYAVPNLYLQMSL
jgi:hypothetical protein